MVSVIIPTFNRNLSLCNTLSCLFKQSYKNYEIIVIDQSNRKFEEKSIFLLNNKNKFKYLTAKIPNASRARNMGISKARGSLFLFLDDDVLFDKNLIKNHVKNYTDIRIGAITGRVTSNEEKESENRSIKVGRISWYGKFTDNFSSTIRQEVDTAITCNASWKKTCLDEVGLFDEKFTGPIREDSDLSLRTKKKGYKIIFDPTSVVRHVRDQTGGFRKTEGKINWYIGFFKSETYFFIKHFPKVLLPFILLTRLKWVLYSALNAIRYRNILYLQAPFLGIYRGLIDYSKRNEHWS
jgi:GT2 family glycosyltransferase